VTVILEGHAAKRVEEEHAARTS